MISREKLFEIHRLVTARKWVSDQENYGKVEHWCDIMRAASKTGDCDDTMLGIVIACLEAGWPITLLRMAFYRTPDGGHAVSLIDIPNDESVTGLQTYMCSNGLPFPLIKEDIPADWIPVSYQIAGTDKWELA